MNFVLTAAKIDKLLDMGYFQGRKIPQRAVLIMPRDPEKDLPLVIDDQGYRTTITFDHAYEL